MAVIAPIVCTPEIARLIGAEPYVEPPTCLDPPGTLAFMAQAAEAVRRHGLLPVLTHGRGAVWALAIDPDAHRRR